MLKQGPQKGNLVTYKIKYHKVTVTAKLLGINLVKLGWALTKSNHVVGCFFLLLAFNLQPSLCSIYDIYFLINFIAE